MAASRVVVTFMMVALVAVSDLAESKVANCQRWYQDTCNLCNFGYGRSKDRKECIPCKDKKCQICNDDPSVCPACQDGFGFDKKKKCVKCTTPGCTVCQVDADTCGVCKNGYGANDKGDKCLPCKDKNCLICLGMDTCAECKEGYGVKNDKCVACPENSISCQGGLGICKEGFELDFKKNVCNPVKNFEAGAAEPQTVQTGTGTSAATSYNAAWLFAVSLSIHSILLRCFSGVSSIKIIAQ